MVVVVKINTMIPATKRIGKENLALFSTKRIFFFVTPMRLGI